jgi:hypothetical protein
MVGFILTIVLCSEAAGQLNSQYPVLSKYRKWGIVAGPVLYNKARIYPQYGDYTFQNRPMWGFNAGFEYDFYPDRQWSFITGFLVAYEPIYNIKYRILKQDLYPHFYEDYVDKFKSYAYFSYSVPLLMRLNIQAGKNSFVNFLAGMKVMYFPPGESYYGLVIHNEDMTESREIFGLNLPAQDNKYYGSVIVGAGASYLLKKVLLKANFIYVMNFPSTIKGEYQFGNLFTSLPARGDYKLSGSYLGLVFSASLKKSKKKWGE